MIDDQATEARADTVAVAAQPSSAPTFGAVLATERERQGISIADMAGRLRLHPKQLVAMEAEDFTALPTAPFLRGFVRNYAKELRIDAAPLLAELSKRMAPKSPGPTDRGGGSSLRGPGGDRLPRALVITAAVGALVVFGVIGVMSSRDASLAPEGKAAAGQAASAPAPGTGSATSAAAPASDSSATTAAPPGAADVPATPAEPNASGVGGMPPSSMPEPAKSGSTAETKSPATTAAPATSTPAASAAAGASVPPVAAASTAPGASAPPVAAAPPAAVASKAGAVVRSVRLSFNDAAWVRIEDAEGKILLSQVNEAGTEQRVAGKSPLRLTIGNASSVTLDVAGREVDLKPRTGADNVARLTVE